MARHALILINASPIFCGQHSMMDGSDLRSCIPLRELLALLRGEMSR
jgi:hypothetical protein